MEKRKVDEAKKTVVHRRGRNTSEAASLRLVHEPKEPHADTRRTGTAVVSRQHVDA